MLHFLKLLSESILVKDSRNLNLVEYWSKTQKPQISSSNTKPFCLESKASFIYILKTTYFILQNMCGSLHTSSSVVHKSTVNIQKLRGLLQYYGLVKIHLKSFI